MGRSTSAVGQKGMLHEPAHYSMSREEKQMKELVDFAEKIDELRQLVLIDNDTDNDLVDAYNQGVNAMVNQIQSHLNDIALAKAFGGAK